MHAPMCTSTGVTRTNKKFPNGLPQKQTAEAKYICSNYSLVGALSPCQDNKSLEKKRMLPKILTMQTSKLGLDPSTKHQRKMFFR